MNIATRIEIGVGAAALIGVGAWALTRRSEQHDTAPAAPDTKPFVPVPDAEQFAVPLGSATLRNGSTVAISGERLVGWKNGYATRDDAVAGVQLLRQHAYPGAVDAAFGYLVPGVAIVQKGDAGPFFAVETDSTLVAYDGRSPKAYEPEGADENGWMPRAMDDLTLQHPPLGTITTLIDGAGRVRDLGAGTTLNSG